MTDYRLPATTQGVRDLAEMLSDPEDVLGLIVDEFFDTEEVSLLNAVADNSHVTAELLEQLGTHKAWEVRECVAHNWETTPTPTLSLLATDVHENVRLAVVENPNTPVEALVRLAADEDEEVRETALSAADRFPTDALVELLKPSYPEASVDMPREWLLKLLQTS